MPSPIDSSILFVKRLIFFDNRQSKRKQIKSDDRLCDFNWVSLYIVTTWLYTLRVMVCICKLISVKGIGVVSHDTLTFNHVV